MRPALLENTGKISYLYFARTNLEGGDLVEKCLQSPVEWTTWTPYSLPSLPGRRGRLAFSDQHIKFPKHNRLFELEKKAIALHSFANHELLAIEMMASALLLYPHNSDEGIRFKHGILTALREEQKHLGLYIGRLNELGYEFGDFPLNDFFWRQMEKLRTPSQYTSVMSLTFEAANLDFAQFYAKVFRELGDEGTAKILDIVLEDEIGHVAFGGYWMKKWRGDKNLWDYYQESLPWPLTPARSKGVGFDPNIHRKAMGDDGFINSLASFEDTFRVTRRSL
jgi:hypothetical protein